jgi:hypothetical protein
MKQRCGVLCVQVSLADRRYLEHVNESPDRQRQVNNHAPDVLLQN